MTRDLNGMHTADGNYSFNEQFVNDICTGGMVLMDFQLRDNPHTQMHSNWECDNWVWIRAGCPPWPGGDPRGVIGNANKLVGVRMYQQDWRAWALKVDGAGKWSVDVARCKQWAQITVEQLSGVRGGKFNPGYRWDMLADPNVIIWPWNEPDIEPKYEDYMRQEWWYDLIGKSWLVWAEEVRRIAGVGLRAALATTPLAGGHDIPGWAPDQEYRQAAMKAMVDESDVLNAHSYGHLNHGPQFGAFGSERYWDGILRPFRPYGWKNDTEGWADGQDYGGVITQYPRKPVLISECGFFDWSNAAWPHLEEFYRVCSEAGNVLLCAPFIAHSFSPHEGNRIFVRDSSREYFRHMTRYQGAPWPFAVTPPVPPVEIPVSKANPFGYLVGSGMQRKAEELGWTLLSDEIYHDPADRSSETRTAFSECFCDQGRLYHHEHTGTLAVPFADPATTPDHK